MIQVNPRPGSADSTHWVVSRYVFDHTHRLGGSDSYSDSFDSVSTDSADTPNKHSNNKSISSNSP